MAKVVGKQPNRDRNHSTWLSCDFGVRTVQRMRVEAAGAHHANRDQEPHHHADTPHHGARPTAQALPAIATTRETATTRSRKESAFRPRSITRIVASRAASAMKASVRTTAWPNSSPTLKPNNGAAIEPGINSDK